MPALTTSTETGSRQPEIALYENPPKVLIVEDEAIIALDIERQLIQAGFVVSGKAQTASQSFRQIERDSPDIVLMDIRLKGEMDGVQAADTIRKRYALPVIYLTAHSDNATLDRARATQPYGFLVKPLANTNIKATITMAIAKHQGEREVESNRKLLTTLLHGLADAVLVAHPFGETLFLNRTAEEITGWHANDVVGKSVFEVIPLHDQDGCEVLPRLFRQIVNTAAPVPIGRDCKLIRKDGKLIPVTGQVSAMLLDNRIAGIFIALQNATAQQHESLRHGQERQIFVASEIAQSVAREFFALFDLIEHSTDGGQPKQGAPGDIALIRKATGIGKGMATQLLEFKEGFGSAHLVNVKQRLLSSKALLQGVCGDKVKLQVSNLPDVGYVLCTGSHFEQMLVNLVMEGRQRLEGRGNLILGACVHKEADRTWRYDSYVRIFLRAEREQINEPAFDETLTFGTERPELSLALVRAIVTASEGFTRVQEPDDAMFILEVFLPRQESRIVATAASNEYAKVLMSVRLLSTLNETLKSSLQEDVLVLEAGDAEEAAWISEMFEGDIDLVIFHQSGDTQESEERARQRIRARRPGISYLQLSAADDVLNRRAEFVQFVTDVLNAKTGGTMATHS